MVIVTGELKSGTGTAPSTTFWASNIEKMDKENEIVNLANVKNIKIMLLESFPVQINVVAKGLHSDSCTEIDKITTRREENTFFVTITASRPADAICAQVITPFEEVIALDVIGLEAGVYTVDVNGVRDTFELPTDNIPD
jgi:inhibitor of cysteine peptidase